VKDIIRQSCNVMLQLEGKNNGKIIFFFKLFIGDHPVSLSEARCPLINQMVHSPHILRLRNLRWNSTHKQKLVVRSWIYHNFFQYSEEMENTYIVTEETLWSWINLKIRRVIIYLAISVYCFTGCLVNISVIAWYPIPKVQWEN